MSPRLTTLLAALAVGCGPKTQDDPTGSETGASEEATGTMTGMTGMTGSTGSTGSTSEPGDEASTSAPTTGDPPLELTPDQQLCLDRCKNWQDDGCPYFDAGCFESCLGALEYIAGSACEAQTRAAWTCELQQALDANCETVECTAEYLQQDLCGGFCSHFGGYPSSGGSQEDCHWAGDGCYGHDLEVRCTLGDEPECTCMADALEIGTCTLDMKLEPFSCGGEGFHVLSTCCTPMFLEVIQ